MGRIKELLNDIDITNEDIEMDLLQRNEDQLEYEEWLHSEGFVEYVNGEIDSTKSRYSESDIMGATRYASEQITIDPSEVGKEVYDMLFSEKIEEYLSLYVK
jgi:hypothetical protein